MTITPAAPAAQTLNNDMPARELHRQSEELWLRLRELRRRCRASNPRYGRISRILDRVTARSQRRQDLWIAAADQGDVDRSLRDRTSIERDRETNDFYVLLDNTELVAGGFHRSYHDAENARDEWLYGQIVFNTLPPIEAAAHGLAVVANERCECGKADGEPCDDIEFCVAPIDASLAHAQVERQAAEQAQEITPILNWAGNPVCPTCGESEHVIRAPFRCMFCTPRVRPALDAGLAMEREQAQQQQNERITTCDACNAPADVRAQLGADADAVQFWCDDCATERAEAITSSQRLARICDICQKSHTTPVGQDCPHCGEEVLSHKELAERRAILAEEIAAGRWTPIPRITTPVAQITSLVPPAPACFRCGSTPAPHQHHGLIWCDACDVAGMQRLLATVRRARLSPHIYRTRRCACRRALTNPTALMRNCCTHCYAQRFQRAFEAADAAWQPIYARFDTLRDKTRQPNYLAIDDTLRLNLVAANLDHQRAFNRRRAAFLRLKHWHGVLTARAA